MFYVHEVQNFCVLAIFERRHGRLGSKISGYGQLAKWQFTSPCPIYPRAAYAYLVDICFLRCLGCRPPMTWHATVADHEPAPEFSQDPRLRIAVIRQAAKIASDTVTAKPFTKPFIPFLGTTKIWVAISASPATIKAIWKTVEDILSPSAIRLAV